MRGERRYERDWLLSVSEMKELRSWTSVGMRNERTPFLAPLASTSKMKLCGFGPNLDHTPHCVLNTYTASA
jgi:hypothetical protein